LPGSGADIKRRALVDIFLVLQRFDKAKLLNSSGAHDVHDHSRQLDRENKSAHRM
jgi:hypothetical protein